MAWTRVTAVGIEGGVGAWQAYPVFIHGSGRALIRCVAENPLLTMERMVVSMALIVCESLTALRQVAVSWEDIRAKISRRDAEILLRKFVRERWTPDGTKSVGREGPIRSQIRQRLQRIWYQVPPSSAQRPKGQSKRSAV